MESNLMSVGRAASNLGITRQAIYEAIRRGRFRPVRVSVTPDLTVLLIPSDQIAAYRVTSLRQPGRKPKS